MPTKDETLHPVVALLVESLGHGPVGEMVFTAPVAALRNRVQSIADPAERLLVARELVTFAYYLDVKQGAAAAAQQVVELALVLVPALEQQRATGGQAIDLERAERFVAQQLGGRQRRATAGLQEKCTSFGLRLRRSP